MRIILLLVVAGGAGWGGGDAVGVWTLSPGRSTFAADRQPRSLTVRIERHYRGEVFTVDRTEQDGRSTTDSTLLFLDGKPREYQDPDCNGTQSSQRVDNRTGARSRGSARPARESGSCGAPRPRANDWCLEITEQIRVGGFRRFDFGDLNDLRGNRAVREAGRSMVYENRPAPGSACRRHRETL